MTITIASKPRIVADGFAFAENPRWHDGRLWFVDIHGGRVYVVQYGFDWRVGETPAAGSASGMQSGNGMALSSDGRTFLIAESGACRVSAFDRDEQGRLSNRRIFAQLPDGYYPDGICIDNTGGAWIACCWGLGTIRVEEGGSITHLVPSDEGRNPFACVFGGPDRKTLYICTAKGEDPVSARAKMSSRIEAIEVGFTGAGLP